jgi:hypothetical protein
LIYVSSYLFFPISVPESTRESAILFYKPM